MEEWPHFVVELLSLGGVVILVALLTFALPQLANTSRSLTFLTVVAMIPAVGVLGFMDDKPVRQTVLMTWAVAIAVVAIVSATSRAVVLNRRRTNRSRSATLVTGLGVCAAMIAVYALFSLRSG